MMRILFLIQEPHQEPLGAGYLISSARAAGHQASGMYFRSSSEAVRASVELRPDIVAFSVMTGSHGMYAGLSRLIKSKLNTFAVFGGPHPTYSPEIIREDGVDAVYRGEGESAFVEFLNRMQHSGDFLHSPNFVFMSGGDSIENPLSPLISDLDSIPFPDRDFFYQSDSLRISHLKSFIATRGCPYSCTYCFNHVYNEMYRGLGPVVRRRSVDNVIAEVLDVKNRFPLGMIQFMDDTFILSSEWLEHFSEEFPARASVPFFCNVRAELVTHESVRDLKRAGCASVCLGIESGDEELRARMLGRQTGNGRIEEACRILRANGIRVMTTNMLGIPGGTLESDLKTWRLNRSCRVDYAWASLTYPYPGTKIHSLAKEAGFNVPDGNALTHSYFNSMQFPSPDARKIENLHRLLAATAEPLFPEPLLKLLIRIAIPPVPAIYKLIFGFWKLYRYETRIFRRRGSWWLLSADFWPRFISNISLGIRMMFPGRGYESRQAAEK